MIFVTCSCFNSILQPLSIISPAAFIILCFRHPLIQCRKTFLNIRDPIVISQAIPKISQPALYTFAVCRFSKVQPDIVFQSCTSCLVIYKAVSISLQPVLISSQPHSIISQPACCNFATCFYDFATRFYSFANNLYDLATCLHNFAPVLITSKL